MWKDEKLINQFQIQFKLAPARKVRTTSRQARHPIKTSKLAQRHTTRNTKHKRLTIGVVAVEP
jgi:hypothetical protein